LRTGKNYRLPSEAQWEYACRAGTGTPFYFGETITSELANYDGREAYRDGAPGENRQETTDVGRFPANAWGLQDMHGNVWEWSGDDLTPSKIFVNYDWVASVPHRKLLCGGAWGFHASSCRSASCHFLDPQMQDGHIGLRVCCLPAG
jgi:formylglycine-generating enzyme required for sulfatase activity